jgi:uncharacterized protein YdaU (DUF1376 family)
MKDVPYFPLYAANIIASRNYKLMSLGERGLWITILMECWVNGGVPADFKQMAKILGFPEQEINQFLSDHQTAFFHIENGQYISRELEEYRQGYLVKREKQRLGGIKGAKEKKAKQKFVEIETQGIPEGQPTGSLIQFNSASIKSNSINSNQLAKKKLTDEEFEAWMDDSKDAPDIANEYLRQSRG